MKNIKSPLLFLFLAVFLVVSGCGGSSSSGGHTVTPDVERPGPGEDTKPDDGLDDSAWVAKIENYQTFVDQVRPWLTVAWEHSPEELASAIVADERALRATADVQIQARLQFLGEVIDQVITFVAGDAYSVIDELGTGYTTQIVIRDTYSRDVGRVDVVVSEDENELHIIASGYAGDGKAMETTPLELSLATGVAVDELSVGDVSGAIARAQRIQALAGRAHKLSADIGQQGDIHYLHLDEAEVRLTLSSNLQGPIGAEFERAASGPAFGAVTLSGAGQIISGDHTFSGTLEVELERSQDEASLFVDERFKGNVLALTGMLLDGEFVSGGSATQFYAVASVELDNTVVIDPFWWANSTDTILIFQGDIDYERDIAGTLLNGAGPGVGEVLIHRVFNAGSDARRGGELTEDLYVESPDDPTWLYFFDGSLTEPEIQSLKEGVLNAVFRSKNVEVTDLVTEETLSFSGTELVPSATLEQGALYGYDLLPDTLSIGFPAAAFPDVAGAANMSVPGYTGLLVRTASGSFEVVLYSDGKGPEALVDVVSQSIQNEVLSLLGLTYVDLISGDLKGKLPRTKASFELCIGEEIFKEQGPFSGSELQRKLNCAIQMLRISEESRTYALSPDVARAVTDFISHKIAKWPHSVIEYLYPHADIEYLAGGLGRWYAHGQITDVDGANDYLQGSITTMVEVEFPDLPKADVIATFSHPDLLEHRLRAYVGWGENQYTINAAANHPRNPDATQLRFTNAEGYDLVVNATFTEGKLSGFSGQALIDGERLGEVQWRDNRPVLVFTYGANSVIEPLY